MFMGMVQIYNLAGTMKLFFRNIPYPKSAITNNANICGSISTLVLSTLVAYHGARKLFSAQKYVR